MVYSQFDFENLMKEFQPQHLWFCSDECTYYIDKGSRLVNVITTIDFKGYMIVNGIGGDSKYVTELVVMFCTRNETDIRQPLQGPDHIKQFFSWCIAARLLGRQSTLFCWLATCPPGGWNSVFVMIIMSVFIAELFLIHIAKFEIETKRAHKKWFWHNS